MTTFSCSLDFGVLELEGIEARSEKEAREIAMKTFSPVLKDIDEDSIKIAVIEKKTRPLLSDKRRFPESFDITKIRNKSRRRFYDQQERLCKLVVRNAEIETGVK
ncbi:MAG: hypothetical protein M0Z77_08260 [Thermoplasmatales archaeon]|jgi:hypothetical protein|nr:hypothetical protein [Candidatus Thermoplasmatota archaeon]MCL6003332.1 hypothetical protein [Candidatus Thermoplasmatota archaeon]MDA8055620.1 hypothetical protein [Thermoplasmatales archaeon]